VDHDVSNPMNRGPTFSALETQRAALLTDVAGWPAAVLAYRPAPGAWSAPEVLHHLVRVERGILAEAERGLGAPHPRGLRDRLGCALLDRVCRSKRRVRMPASVAARVAPAPAAHLVVVRAEWDATRRDLARFLDRVPALRPDQQRGGVFRHPVAGWMGVPEVLRFFWAHAYHHAFQLARLRADAPRAVRADR
jgi:hypothetical protein